MMLRRLQKLRIMGALVCIAALLQPFLHGDAIHAIRPLLNVSYER
jgi:hypothetical protein